MNETRIPLGEHSPITLALRAINMLKSYAPALVQVDQRLLALAELALNQADSKNAIVVYGGNDAQATSDIRTGGDRSRNS